MDGKEKLFKFISNEFKLRGTDKLYIFTNNSKCYNDIFVKNTKYIPNNYNNIESYSWIEKTIEYFPIFGLELDKNQFIEEFDRIYEYIVYADSSKYCFILDIEKIEQNKNNKMIYTNFYNWCDVHYLLQKDISTEKERINEDDKISFKYIVSNLDKCEFIQFLLKELNKDEIISYIKYKEN